MKLYHSPASPYSRKARVVAHECGLGDRIELIAVNPRARDGDYGRINPLQRVPALVRDDGETLFDSPVICEYLCSLAPEKPLLPASGEARWQVLKLHALADGILEAAVPRRIEEAARPAERRWDEQLFVYRRAMGQGLDLLEQLTDRLDAVNLGTLATGCVLHYMDFRFPDDSWRDGRPRLAGWFAEFGQRPSFAATVPA